MTTTDPAPLTGMPPPPAPPPQGRAPDHPRVPRPKISLGAVVLAMFGTVVVGSYAAMAYTDFEPGSPQRAEVPASVRSSPGGYRTYHFWHSGYHGGK